MAPLGRLERTWAVARFVYDRFSETEALEAAAAIAYYALFSLFPLLLFVVAFNSTFLGTEAIQKATIDFIEQSVPNSRELVSENIRQLILQRNAFGVVGMIALLWAATGVFAGIAQNVNRAWTKARRRNFLEDRFLALLMIVCLTGFLVFSLVLTAVVNVIPHLIPSGTGTFFDQMGVAVRVSLRVIPLLSVMCGFLLLYKWIPSTYVRWGEAAWGAGVAAFCWELTKSGFVWYLGNAWASFLIIYGSLGAMVALMLWIYCGSVIILLGAHVSAAMAHFSRTGRGLEENEFLNPTDGQTGGPPFTTGAGMDSLPGPSTSQSPSE